VKSNFISGTSFNLNTNIFWGYVGSGRNNLIGEECANVDEAYIESRESDFLGHVRPNSHAWQTPRIMLTLLFFAQV